MNIKAIVRYDVRDNYWGLSNDENVISDSISSFVDFVTKRYLRIMQLAPITVARVVELYNADAPVVSGNYLKLCDYTTDKFDFYVMNSLMYKQDIDMYMTKDFPHYKWHYMNLPKNKTKKPLLFVTRAGWGIDGIGVEVKELTKKDCVINKEGQQIWPVNTGNYPSKLVEMLNKKTEEINLVR